MVEHLSFLRNIGAHLVVRPPALASPLVETSNPKVATLATPDFDHLPTPPRSANRLVTRAHSCGALVGAEVKTSHTNRGLTDRIAAYPEEGNGAPTRVVVACSVERT